MPAIVQDCAIMLAESIFVFQGKVRSSSVISYVTNSTMGNVEALYRTWIQSCNPRSVTCTAAKFMNVHVGNIQLLQLKLVLLGSCLTTHSEKQFIQSTGGSCGISFEETLHQGLLKDELEDGIDDVAPQTPISEKPSETNESPQNSKELPISRPNFAKRRKSVELTNDVLLSVRDHFKKPSPQDDRYDLLKKSIAMRMRTLEKRQRLIVEKIVDDFLYEAKMRMLNVPTSSYSSEYLTSSSSSTSSPSPTAATSYHQFTQQTAPAEFVTNQELPLPHSAATYLATYNNI
ncbi:uncharacterized protein LOC126213426 isoform X3 [Schistocerca nitens]|uniref:uncharacterized protein LOC126213426 isoform X3 n=1 Tax=Schistocerca nitens TaxID=7011 RepID=UPI002119111A|nr:uncharacterized protein LOC126213426 isoform X3 [Schistocerca nitens]